MIWKIILAEDLELPVQHNKYMDPEKTNTPENEEDELLSIAEDLYRHPRLPNEKLTKEAYQDPATFEKINVNKFRRNWFQGVSEVISSIIEEGRVSESQAKELKDDRDKLIIDLNIETIGAPDAQKRAAEEGGQNIDEENRPIPSLELVDRGDELLLKAIAFARKDEVLEEAVRARFQWKRMSDYLTKEIYDQPKKFKKIENNKYRWGWFNLVSGVVDFIVQDKRGGPEMAQALYEEKVVMLDELNKYLRDTADKERIYDEKDPWKRKKIAIPVEFLDRGDALLDKSIDILINSRVAVK